MLTGNKNNLIFWPSFFSLYSSNCTLNDSPYLITAEQAETCVAGPPTTSPQSIDHSVEKWHYVS